MLIPPLIGDVAGLVAYHAADGIFPLAGRPVVHRHMTETPAILQWGPGRLRRRLSVAEALLAQVRVTAEQCGIGAAPTSYTIVHHRLEEIEQEVLRAARTMLAWGTVNRHMATVMRPHWARVHEVLDFIAFHLRGTSADPTPPRPPRPVGAWFRVAVVWLHSSSAEYIHRRMLNRRERARRAAHRLEWRRSMKRLAACSDPDTPDYFVSAATGRR